MYITQFYLQVIQVWNTVLFYKSARHESRCMKVGHARKSASGYSNAVQAVHWTHTHNRPAHWRCMHPDNDSVLTYGRVVPDKVSYMWNKYSDLCTTVAVWRALLWPQQNVNWAKTTGYYQATQPLRPSAWPLSTVRTVFLLLPLQTSQLSRWQALYPSCHYSSSSPKTMLSL